MTPPRFSESEPNDSPDQATPLPVDLIAVGCGRDVQTALRTDCPGSDDWFRFTVPASEGGKTLRIQFFGEVDDGGGPVVTLSLWGSGQMLEQVAAIPGKAPRINHLLDPNSNPTGIYSLSISCGPGQLGDGVFYISIVP